MQQTMLGAIEARYSCRDFQTGRPLSGEELALLLQAGRLAPSAFGLEPWRFVTVVDAPMRQAVARACFDQPAVSTAAALIVIVALVDALDPDSSYVSARFEAEARGGDAAPVHDAYRAFYHPDAIEAWALGQCNFAAAHMLLQAAHMGLGSCPVGGFDADSLSAVMSLPAGEKPALVIALGHCAEPAPARIRKPL